MGILSSTTLKLRAAMAGIGLKESHLAQDKAGTPVSYLDRGYQVVLSSVTNTAKYSDRDKTLLRLSYNIKTTHRLRQSSDDSSLDLKRALDDYDRVLEVLMSEQEFNETGMVSFTEWPVTVSQDGEWLTSTMAFQVVVEAGWSLVDA